MEAILDYYRLRYNHELEFPNLPLFRMRPPERNIYIPMELVTISDEVTRIVRRLQPADAAKVLEVLQSYLMRVRPEPSYQRGSVSICLNTPLRCDVEVFRSRFTWKIQLLERQSYAKISFKTGAQLGMEAKHSAF